MKRQNRSMKSKFTALENHFLNTFFSGLYISAGEFIETGRKIGIKLSMNSREMLIKDLLNKSDENGTLNQTVDILNGLIEQRVEQYNSLSRDYPASAQMLSQLAHKATSTKSLLSRESQRSQYEQ